MGRRYVLRFIFMLFFILLFLSISPASVQARDQIWQEMEQLDHLLNYVPGDDFLYVDPVNQSLGIDTRGLQLGYSGLGQEIQLTGLLGQDPFQLMSTSTTLAASYADLSDRRDYWFNIEESAQQSNMELGMGQEVYRGRFQDNQFSLSQYRADTLAGNLNYERTSRGHSVNLDSSDVRFTADTSRRVYAGGRLVSETLQGVWQGRSGLLSSQNLSYSFSRLVSGTEVTRGVIRDIQHGRTYSGTWTESNGRSAIFLSDGRATANLSLTDTNLYFSAKLANKKSYSLTYRGVNDVYSMSGLHDKNSWNLSIRDEFLSASWLNLKTRSRTSTQARLVSPGVWQGSFLDSSYSLAWTSGNDDLRASLQELRSGDSYEISTTKDKAADERHYYAQLGKLTLEGVDRTGLKSLSWSRAGHPETWHAELLQSGKDRTLTIEDEGFLLAGELINSNQSGSATLTSDDLTGSARFNRTGKSWTADIDGLYQGKHRYHFSGDKSGDQETYFFETESDYVLFTRTGDSKQLEFTHADQVYTWDNATIEQVLHGNLDTLVTRLHDDCGLKLDFDYRWGTRDSNFVRFDDDSHTLSMHIDGHEAWVKTSTGGTAFSYHSPDDKIGLTGATDDHSKGVYFSEARYADDFMSLDFAGVTLDRWDPASNSIGLYFGDTYVVKLHSADKDELTPWLEDAWEKALSGDLGREERNSFIRTAVKQIDVNARELAKNHLTFQDQRWNDLMTSLAWDVGEFSLTAEQIIEVVDAADHKEQLYNVLEGILPGTLKTSLLNAERQVSLDLGLSLIDQKESARRLAVTGFSTGTRINYDGAWGGNLFSQGGGYGTVSRGYLDVQTPVFGPGSRTMLGFSAPAERLVYRWDDESNAAGVLNFSSTGVLYAYHFSEDMTFRLTDGHAQNLSLFGSSSHAFTYALEDDPESGVILPGALWRTKVATPNEFWYAHFTAVPYIPLSLGKDLEFSFGREASSSALPITSFNLATDIRTGFNTQLAGHRSHVEFGKTVNNGFLVAPEFDVLKDHLTLGLDAETGAGNNPSWLNYHADIKWQDFQNRLFMEQNLFAETRTVGTSLERKVGDKSYAFSYGVSSWDNAGVWESVESYFAVGFGFRDRFSLMQAVTFNEIDLSTAFRNSAQVVLFKDRSVSLAWDTTLKDSPDGLDVGVGLRTMLQF